MLKKNCLLLSLSKVKNFFLTYVYPVSFFFLSFCGHNNKEHHISYEQMPLEVKTDASEEVKSWIATFKKGYYPRHLDQVIHLILSDAWKDSKTKTAQDITQKENLEFVFGENPNDAIQFQKNILERIDSNDLFKFKNNLELFIKNDLEKSTEPLIYNSETTNPLNAFANKTVSHASYTQLLQILFAKTQGQNKLRKKELFLIFTPERVSIGFIKKDDSQGKLLFGISSTQLGSKAIKYYGPTKKLTGNIAVVDLELALILSALSDKITNLKDARNFALDQSAKKTGIQLSKLTHNFKDTNRLVFELSGTPFETAAPNNGQKLLEADFSYVEGASSLNSNELKSSYKAYIDHEKQKESEKKRKSNSSALGSFHGWTNAEAFVADFFSYKKEYAPTSKILRMPVTRKCHADTAANDKKDYLRDWFVFGQIRSYWKFETLEEDHLSYCQNKKNLGENDDDNNTAILQAHSRILQPIFVALPKNPKNPETLPAEEEALEIHNQQEKLVKELAVDFCSQLNMKSVFELETLKSNPADVLNLWKELFHGDEQTTTQAFPNNAKNNNFYEIKCISLGTKSELSSTTEEKENKELELKKKTPELSLKTTPLLPAKR